MLQKNIDAVSAKIQIKEFEALSKPDYKGDKLNFVGSDGYDVYNPSIPFELDGMTIIAGRVENRSNEESDTMFFKKTGDVWQLITNAPVLKGVQDPFVTFIDSELWLGGVYVEWDGPKLIQYYTVFYSGKSIFDLKLTAQGPKFMKDIRLLQLKDGRVAVCSRPQGEPMLKKFGCIAKIGFTIANKKEDVNADLIAGAPLLEGQFIPTEWGGANQLYQLSNGLIGVIGHKSWGEYIGEVYHIHYYSMAFALNPDTMETTQTKMISCRDCFPKGPQKNTRTADVTFTSGIIRRGDGKCDLYTGLNDCEVGHIVIEDPLCEYEGIRI